MNPAPPKLFEPPRVEPIGSDWIGSVLGGPPRGGDGDDPGASRLRLALAAGRMGTWDWNLLTGAIDWSPGLEAILGLPPGTFDGTFEGFRHLVLAEDLPRVQEAIRQSLEAGAGYEIEFRIARPDGSIGWILGTGQVFRGGDGRPTRMIGLAMDIDARKRDQEVLRQSDERHRAALAELREADRRKDVFLATLGHELRNPLASIRNALHLMGSPGSFEDAQAQCAMAERQVEHLGRLVDDLMDMARINQGKLELRKQPIELGALIARAVSAARPALAGRNQDLRVALPPRLVPLLADPIRLEQVFGNLLSNAIKYTDPGGSIALEARVEGDRAVVEVRDNGVGIDPEMISKVFEMFVQVDPHADRAQGGLGIGLGLVRMLVELHGGRVEAASAGVGRGSTFTVELPIEATRSEEIAAPPPPRRPEAPPRRRVLVVDDNRDAATSLGMILTRLLGQEVRLAHDGPQALIVAEEFAPEVVLLDLGLPGMDGFAVAQRLRTRPEGDRMVLVALTGWGQESDRKRSRAAGFDRHLVKPVDPEAIRSVLTSGSRAN